MRYFCLRAVTMIAVCGLVPSVVFGQGTPSFSITNYQYVSEQRISQSSSYVTYRADLVNAGTARTAVTASVSSQVSSIQVVPGQGVLHFAPVPANSTVTSLNTFTILVDRTVAFDFAGLGSIETIRRVLEEPGLVASVASAMRLARLSSSASRASACRSRAAIAS